MKHDLIDKVAWVGGRYLNGNVRGIILRFAGLGGTAGLKNDADWQELEWGEAGGLSVFPYYNPWAWMNGATVAFVDELVAALREKFATDAPLIVSGGSMGGHAALAYALKSSHRVAACWANCPVCDLLHHYGERPDLPRTFHSAFGGYGDIAAQLREYSPLHQVAKMPRIPYFIMHGCKDASVSKAAHSDKFCAEMRALGHDLVYREEPEMLHCGPWTHAAARASTEFVACQLGK